MIKLALAFFLSFLALSAIGQQNLVPNPSFEEYTSCPDSYGDLPLAAPWFQPFILASSCELFAECCVSSTYCSVPSNTFGSQYGRTGKAYSGIGFWAADIEVREYIEVKLMAPLKTGKKYCVEFYVSLGETCNYGIANIGAYFSPDSVLDDPPLVNPLLPNTPQINNPNGPIIEKNNWVLISEEFIADGGEQFMIIGNFFSDANTTIQHTGDSSNMNYTYYYIDDVSVTCCDVNGCEGVLEDIPNVFTPNGDGVNEVFAIEATGLENISCEIFNRWGIKVAALTQPNETWDGRTTSGQPAVEGVYYYVVRAKGTEGDEISRTGFVQLLR